MRPDPAIGALNDEVDTAVRNWSSRTSFSSATAAAPFKRSLPP